jgi:hypothetical protein
MLSSGKIPKMRAYVFVGRSSLHKELAVLVENKDINRSMIVSFSVHYNQISEQKVVTVNFLPGRLNGDLQLKTVGMI